MKMTQNSQNKLKRKNIGGLMLFVFKNYNKGEITKSVWYWHKNKHIYQWNRMKYHKIDSNIYSQLIFGKFSKVIQ